ncbi:hypothetical protein [Hydrogenophaga sp. NFH-34]|uniref:hypothetical protein n=1 Tax=Hydrogenophaga sp. NFH-34 TaxID=2744446 RepID=UPI001F1580B4|nr:hypothetical protein [Hydrogenophaga sp. NFH-34]
MQIQELMIKWKSSKNWLYAECDFPRQEALCPPIAEGPEVGRRRSRLLSKIENLKEPVMLEFYAAVFLMFCLLGWLGWHALQNPGISDSTSSKRIADLERKVADLEKRLEASA